MEGLTECWQAHGNSYAIYTYLYFLALDGTCGCAYVSEGCSGE